jgi:HAD superfamily hydrolase (TIGR01549 family)
MPSDRPPAALLDVDGTLVDSTYHHAIAWQRAFARFDCAVAAFRIHRHVGMGGDQIVAALTSEEWDSEHGDEARDAHDEIFQGSMMDEIPAFEGARDLLEELKRRGHPLVIASSASQEELDHYLDLLGARDLADAWTSSGDVDNTKPEPDLIEVAREKAGGGDAVMVGDATWDCEAAANAGIPTIGLLTGGFSEAELRDAGADPVFESLIALREGLDETPLAR